jgi:hypothetical protein
LLNVCLDVVRQWLSQLKHLHISDNLKKNMFINALMFANG